MSTSGAREAGAGAERSAAGFGIFRREAIEEATLWAFVAGLGWVPLWYGGNALLAWGVNAVLFPGLVVAYESSLVIRGKSHPVGVRHLLVPAALFGSVLLWIALQTVPIENSSIANPVWGMASKALQRPLSGSISVAPDLTILALVRLITAASVFWLALQLGRDERRALRLIGSVAAIGCGYAAYGILTIKTGQPAWLQIPSGKNIVSATFVDPDSYATYAGIGLIATLGLVVRFYRDAASGGGSWRPRLASFIETTGHQGGALLAAAFLILAALLLTGSRGGISATLLGVVAFGFLVRRGKRSEGKQASWALAAVFFLVAASLFTFGNVFADKLDQGGLYDKSRMAVYALTWHSIVDAPVWGWGYGTFRDVFPMYRDRSLAVWGTWAQAHDTYLEILQGLGLVFGPMLIGSVLALVIQATKGAVRRRENAIAPCVAASAAVLVGVHAFVDFSLQIQAVAITFMALLGAGVAQSASSRRPLQD